ncbi:hypothetical protein ACWIFN_35385, partial [Streptomyces adustus]
GTGGRVPSHGTERQPEFLLGKTTRPPKVPTGRGPADIAGARRRSRQHTTGRRQCPGDRTRRLLPETALDLDSARRILSWAKAGLPIVVVGDPVLRTRGLNQDSDAALRKVLAELRRQSTVQQVAEESDVLSALRTAEVEPAASYAGASDLLNLHRGSGDTDYHSFWNSGKDRETTTVTLTGSGRPYRHDPWTGKVTPIAAYTRTADGVRVEVSAASGGSVPSSSGPTRKGPSPARGTDPPGRGL